MRENHARTGGWYEGRHDRRPAASLRLPAGASARRCGGACSPAVGKLRFMGSNAAGNPYRPGRGVAPPVLAGRASVLDIAEERLDVLGAGGMPPQDLLLYGPRGNGKTTLLIEIERRARERGLRVEELPADALATEEKLVRHLQERAGVLGPQITGAQVAGIGVSAARAAPTREIRLLLAAWIGAGPLVIVMDEVHALSPKAARPFFDAVQSAKREPHPFLVVAAGTPDAPRRVREAATYNERGFEQFPVGRLRPAETITALAEPAQMSGRPMSADAAALLAEESQDYPYFIQIAGERRLEGSGGGRERNRPRRGPARPGSVPGPGRALLFRALRGGVAAEDRPGIGAAGIALRQSQGTVASTRTAGATCRNRRDRFLSAG